MISVLNSFTRMGAGCVSLAVGGFMAHEQNKPVSEVAASGISELTLGSIYLLHPNVSK